MTSRPIILAFLLLLSLGLYAHGDKTPLSLSGIISNSSGEGVGNAVISLEQNGEVIQSTRSDQQGQFTLQFSESLLKFKDLKITVKKRGFITEELVPAACSKGLIQLHLQKSPTPIPVIRPVGISQTIVI